MKFTQKNAGFSLVEMLLVILVVMVLYAAMIPIYQSYVDKARFLNITTSMHSIKKAIYLCYVETANLQQCVTDQQLGLGESTDGISPPNKYFQTVQTSFPNNNTIVLLATSSTEFSSKGQRLTYVLTGEISEIDGRMSWSTSGTCFKTKLCN
jgi:prepilin-type N-terminal cleavage/methylation domain-containing protein